MPFGEVIPFKQNAPWLYNLLMKFSPYDYDYNLNAGTDYTIFKACDYNFGVMICYESTMPNIARNFALGEKGQKQIDWLVNISNDGWFVRFKNDKVIPSNELPQHAVASVFRAVENRVSVLRSVNTGISCLIDSLGRIKNTFAAGNLPKKAMARKGMDGFFVDTVIIDKRITFFSKFGQKLGLLCSFLLFLAIIIPVAEQFVRNKNRKR